MSVRRRVRDLGALEIYSLLVSCTKAKPFRESSKSYDSLVESFVPLLQGKSYPAIQWFFTNLARAVRNGNKGMKVKLDSNYWAGNVCGIGYRKVREIIEWFEYNEYITVYSGNNDYRATWKSYPTIVKFNQKLLDLLDMNSLVLHIPDNLVEDVIVVKDRKTKEILEINPSEELEKMQAEMNTYNNSFKDVLIEFNGQPIPTLEYKRSFSGDLYKGGRLFAHGGSIQLLPERFRLNYLTLDKEKVCEIDYVGIHGCLLYESVAQNNEDVYELAVEGFDPYAADRSAVEVDDRKVVNHKLKYGLTKYDPVRNLFKVSLMMALNCASEGLARQSINHALYEDNCRDEEDRKFIGLIKVDPESVLDAICDHNYLIEEYFYKDYGIVLQNIDSRIALRVIDYLIQDGHTCLAYHDSFAVKESIADFLEFAMKAAWKDVMGENKFCYLDKK